MTEKRFELKPNHNGQVDIVDWVESKEKNAICIYNDLGVLPYTSAPSLCDLLNELDDENEQLKKQLADDFNQSNCITVQKSKINDLKKENINLHNEVMCLTDICEKQAKFLQKKGFGLKEFIDSLSEKSDLIVNHSDGRFESKGRIIIDNKTKLHYIMTLDWECSLVTKLLNQLNDENEQLK